MNNLNNVEKTDNELLERYYALYDVKLDSIEELLDILSEEFASNYDRIGDAQLAFDTLEDENKELMKDICFLYNLSGDSSWSITTGDGYKEENLDKYIKAIRECYDDESIETLQDVLWKIEHRVDKDMCNAGCDMFTALDMILTEDLDLGDDDVFVIDGADEEPRIEIWY